MKIFQIYTTQTIRYDKEKNRLVISQTVKEAC